MPRPGQVDVVVLPGGEEMELVWVPGGTFWMGCLPGRKCSVDEQPRHQVRVDGFWMGRFEVTQRQWKSVMGSNPSQYKGDTRPAESLLWEEAVAFAERAGGGLRLPTEAEWEYAARAGVDGRLYPWGDEPPDGSQANFCDRSCGREYRDPESDDGYATTAPGGIYPENAFGLFDMAGNVKEWCLDAYSAVAYKARTGVSDSPLVTGGDTSVVNGREMTPHVLRGGDFKSQPYDLNLARRVGTLSVFRLDTAGFRVVRPLQAEAPAAPALEPTLRSLLLQEPRGKGEGLSPELLRLLIETPTPRIVLRPLSEPLGTRTPER
jgi:formylglycine-generating enzyme required for sulfatase activity